MSSVSELYQEIEIDSEVMTASPYRLIQMLMDKCLQQIQLAKLHINNKDIKQKHRVINRASDIVEYLRLCLNFEDPSAHAMSTQLDEIYVLITQSLLMATLQNNAELLEPAIIALTNIREGWNGIATKI